MQQPSSQQLLFLLLAGASSFLIFLTSERCFEQADARNAIEFAKMLRANPQAPTIPEALSVLHPDVHSSAVLWSAQLNDTFYGFVRVRVSVPARDTPVEYVFDVNLAGQRLHPGNDAARDLMQKLGSNALSRPVGTSTFREGAAD
jgi:hypothetical protein